MKIIKSKYLLSLLLLAVVLISAYVASSYFSNDKASSSHNNSVVGEDETQVAEVTSADNNFSLKINKIEVEAPVILGVDPSDEEKYNKALQDGVAHMVGTALPGQDEGNIFIYGHSSAEIKSDYSEVFAKMDELQFKDEIEISFEGKKYRYWVSEKKIVEKDDFSVLNQTEDEQLTLMTCWPIGTSDRRIIVVAKRDDI